MRRTSTWLTPKHLAPLAALSLGCGGLTNEDLGPVAVGGSSGAAGMSSGSGGAGGGAGSHGLGGNSSGGAGSGGHGGSEAGTAGDGGSASGGAGGAQSGGSSSGGAAGTPGTGGTDSGCDAAQEAPSPFSEADAGTSNNLIANASFESGNADWVGWPSASLHEVTEYPHTGDACLGISQRSDYYVGAMLQRDTLVSAGASYEVSAWLRAAVPAVSANLMLKALCVGENTSTFTPLATAQVGCAWTRLAGELEVPSCPLMSLHLLIEGAPAGVDLYVDDVTLVPLD